MKTEIITIKDKEQANIFPLVAKRTTGNLTVLFFSERSGIVLASCEGSDTVGWKRDSWISCFNKDEWTIPESLTIEFTNEV